METNLNSSHKTTKNTLPRKTNSCNKYCNPGLQLATDNLKFNQTLSNELQ